MSDSGYITGEEFYRSLIERLTDDQRAAVRLALDIDADSMNGDPETWTRNRLPLTAEELVTLRDPLTNLMVRQILAARIELLEDVATEYRHALDVLSGAMGARLVAELEEWRGAGRE